MTRARDLADGADKDITGTLTLDDIVLSNDMSVADNGKVQFGAGNDLQIYHDASHSYIVDAGTGNFYLSTNGNGIVMQASLSETMFAALPDGAVTLYHDNAAKLATASTGIDVTGNATFGDNGKAIFGAGSDLQIYHDGSASRIVDAGTGGLTLQADANLVVQNSAGTETKAEFTTDGAVNLYHDNNLKLATSSTGVDVTGLVKTSNAYQVWLGANVLGSNGGLTSIGSNPIVIGTDGTERMRIDSSGLVGIGVVPSGTAKLQVNGQIYASADGSASAPAFAVNDGDTGMFRPANNNLAFTTGGSERSRIDSSGHLIVGKTNSSIDGAGHVLNNNGVAYHIASGNRAMDLNREGSDGDILFFRQDNSLQGYISTPFDTSLGIFGPGGNGAGFVFQSNEEINPARNGTRVDDVIGLGNATFRYDRIFAANGTIQTSDQNEKQDITSLTTAEMTAAKAISKLFKTYKWKSRVASKGDAARTHTGMIAQEVQTAMTDAGLDASNYAFWCSDTWWETSTDVAAVEADEQAGVEAKDAYTRIDTYQTADEAPEGATQRTRLGVRYAELLAFVGAATEQRLADIETRLTALEAAT